MAFASNEKRVHDSDIQLITTCMPVPVRKALLGLLPSCFLMSTQQMPVDLFYQACRDSNVVLAPTKLFRIGLKSSCFLLMQVLLAISSSCALTNVKQLSLLRGTFHTLKFRSLGCFATSAL